MFLKRAKTNLTPPIAPAASTEPATGQVVPAVEAAEAAADAFAATRVIPRDVGRLRVRAASLPGEIAQAAEALTAAQAQWHQLVLTQARGESVADTEVSRVRGELADAAAFLDAQKEALEIVSAELAPYDDPARKRAVEAQKAQVRRLSAQRAAALEKLERILSGEVSELFREYHSLRSRMTAALGHGLGGDFSELEDAKWLSGILPKHLVPFLDGTAFDHAKSAWHPDPRPWSEQETERMASRLELLESLS